MVPELASRDHVRKLLPLIRQTLAEAGLAVGDLDGVAYTAGPGLVGALLVGAGVARSLAWALDLPAIGVHHMEGHLLAPLLEADPTWRRRSSPCWSPAGTPSWSRSTRSARYRLLGETLDDAAGEAFDKTAKMMGLPYPGGPQLARWPKPGRPGAFRFSRPMTDRPGPGLQLQRPEDPGAAGLAAAATAREQTRADIARGFEDAVVDTLAIKCERALDAAGCDTLVVAGGVGANQRLRAKLQQAAARARRPRLLPAPGAVHRQRRDDRLRRRAAAGGRPARRRGRSTCMPRWDMASLPPVAAGGTPDRRCVIRTSGEADALSSCRCEPPIRTTHHGLPMDKVFIEGLEIEALIGIYDWERRIRQPLQFDIEMAFDNRRPAASDAIADTLDYKAVSKRLIEFVSQSGFGLVETLAERCASLILDEFAVTHAAPEAEQARRGARRARGRRDHRAQPRAGAARHAGDRRRGQTRQGRARHHGRRAHAWPGRSRRRSSAPPPARRS